MESVLRLLLAGMRMEVGLEGIGGLGWDVDVSWSRLLTRCSVHRHSAPGRCPAGAGAKIPAATLKLSSSDPRKLGYKIVADPPLFAMPHFQTEANKTSEVFISPFWAIDAEDKPRTGNMELKYVGKQVPGIEMEIPVLCNLRPLSEGDLLSCVPPPRKRRRL